jgi:hypothetical protein
MDFLLFEFDPQGFVDLLALGVSSGVVVGVFLVLVTLFYGHRGAR